MDDDHRRRVPRTDTVLADARLGPALATLGRARVKEVVVATQERARAGEIAPEAVADEVVAAMPPTAASLRPVVNATGVLLHTNLGRAPLSPAARDALDLAAGTTDVELDLATGGRGRRGAGTMAALAAAVPDAGGVHVTNNGAAALILAATALAGGDSQGSTPIGERSSTVRGGREIVIARGEMVEIGDGFRLPDLLESTGARLREVGTTNRVHRSDYEDAVGPETGMILKVHPSNFVVTGFTSSVPVSALSDLGVPVVSDIGSGLLAPHPLLPDEPDAATELRAGASLVTASGDKLLGGPQAGLLLGDADLVHRLRRHPLARALRVDKLTLAALEATLRGPTPPVRALLEASVESLHTRATELAEQIGTPATVVECVAQVGGGGAPGVELASAGVALPVDLAVRLRDGADPVVAHVEQGRCVLDLRSVPPSEDARLAAAARAALG
ncbi:L-seryl-tRNA(Sec) selenium transferase [Actinomycetospora sp. NBRC 106375]|uniref:L-seryl-tRNA(Sec) selenium transferase n=1 Tax=Actinomycetospora sp. NBRC 106375 TaxID=3032207 RepID=UPI0024A109FF|nr:L-seryl-tRNA(Sec) selenium transferase [Actinomycetospora sp. NBRC 106375]GLZ49425.1 L-seryl-tRNA(Sec) selenium transferase [Actinomycetospora sp. NBRC 106375]